MSFQSRLAGVNIAALSDEQRDKALQHTATILRELDKVRKTLELPPELLPIVIEIHGQAVSALIMEEQQKAMEARTKRVPLTMRSEGCIKQGDGRNGVVEVLARPQYVAFRPEEISINDNRSPWRCQDVEIGEC